MDNSNQHSVLLVEDIGDISSQFEVMLHRRGYRTLLASNAEQAIRMAENNRPSIILTDLELPTFDSLIQGIRLHATLNDILIAIIDLNHPSLNAKDGVKVLRDFNDLEDVLSAMERPAPPVSGEFSPS